MTDLEQEITEQIAAMMSDAGARIEETLREELSTQGHVSPFVVSAPGGVPFNWDNRLVDGLSYSVEVKGSEVVLTMVSTAYNDDGTSIADREEQGHWWDGWAQDFEDGGKWKFIAPAHWVEPRPYMAPMSDRVGANLTRFLRGG